MRTSVALLLFALITSAVKCTPILPATLRRGGGRGGWSRIGGTKSAKRAAAAFKRKARKNKRKVNAAIILTGNENDEEDREKDIYSCFPARTVVQVGGRFIHTSALRVGDTVRIGPNSFSDIFMFSHAVHDGVFQFVRLTSAAGELTTSPGHLLYTARGALAARDIVRGDFLKAANGSMTKITHVRQVFETGLYNPQTVDGDIVVDGFVVSTFTNAVPVNAASSILSPVRAAYAVLNIDVTGGIIAGDSVIRTMLVSVVKALKSWQCLS